MPQHARICLRHASELKSLLGLDDLTFLWLKRWVSKRNREWSWSFVSSVCIFFTHPDTGTSTLAWYSFARFVATSVCAELPPPVFKCRELRHFRDPPSIIMYLCTSACWQLHSECVHVNHWLEWCYMFLHAHCIVHYPLYLCLTFTDVPSFLLGKK